MTRLRGNYDCHGDFYVWNGHECRKVLNIIHKGSTAKAPDFMVVMMNPGGSAPKPGQPNHGYVPAKPDDTQDQIMEIMDRAGFKYARILNLSDIREPRSSQFRQTLTAVGVIQPHSVLHETRKNEFDNLYVRGVPVLLAWGVHSKLKPLAERALAKIRGEDTRGLKKLGYSWAYYHPLPPLRVKRAAWLANILRQF